jgi:hypothetical protein
VLDVGLDALYFSLRKEPVLSPQPKIDLPLYDIDQLEMLGVAVPRNSSLGRPFKPIHVVGLALNDWIDLPSRRKIDGVRWKLVDNPFLVLLAGFLSELRPDNPAAL